MNFVLVPGAWAGSWIWDQVGADLKQRGHNVHQLTLSGLRDDENARDVGLETHIDDVIDYLESNDLNSVILVGHSYSGIVVGLVTAMATERVCHTVFLEAFLPVQGSSLLDVSGLDVNEELKLIDSNEGYWPAPTLEELKSQSQLSENLVHMLVERQKDHPGKTVTDTVPTEPRLPEIDATFISEKEWLSTSREFELLESLRTERKWSFQTIAGGHWPMLTIPSHVSEILDGIRA